MQCFKDTTIGKPISKFLLWKYENYIRDDKRSIPDINSKPNILFEDMGTIDLEHISPQETKRGEKLAKGYHKYNPKYNPKFINEYLNCIGNYLLLPTALNKGLSNKDFQIKYEEYSKVEGFEQVQEIAEMTKTEWKIPQIETRHEKICKFIKKHIFSTNPPFYLCNK